MLKKNTIIRFGLVFLGIFLFQKAFSQENYLSGYVINKKGDTLHGFIDYRNWERNPNIIDFKGAIDGKSIAYKPIDIIEFSVKDEIYVSGIVNTETSKFKTAELNDDPTIHIRVDTAFLQTLFSGNKSLYYYKPLFGKGNFYIKQDTNFELLVYKRYITNQESKRVIIENKKYIGQLTVYFNDCPSIQSKLINTSYNKKSLEKLFDNYYECSKYEIFFQKKAEKLTTEFGVLAGASLSTLEFRGNAIPYLTEIDFNQSTNFAGGLFLDIVLPRNQGKWSINNELLYSSYLFKGKYGYYENENKYFNTNIEIGSSHLKINNLLRYKYPIGKLYMFFNIGMSNGYAISETNSKIIKTKFYSTETIIKEEVLNNSRKHEQGLLIGGGAKYKKFSFEIRYERGNGMSPYTRLNSLTQRYYCLLGYRF